jgi:predicted ribosomally synthesized peptide with SipW-like signal peptide
MTRLHRKALLLALTAGIVVGGAGSSASASFSDSSTVSTSITTETVAPATDLVGTLTCPARGDATMSATWTLSSSSRISAQQVHVTFSDGYVQTVDLSATATSWSATIDKYYVTNYSVRYSVVTLTAYGWTAETPPTGWFRC